MAEIQPSVIYREGRPTFQAHIVRKYSEMGAPALLDANSGFEPKSFDWQTWCTWKYVLKGPWRFAYDYLPETGDITRMMKILRDAPRKRKRCYVLIGNEPIEACYERAIRVVELGGEPFCQPLLPLNALNKHDFTLRYDWSKQKLIDFARYFNRFLWKYAPLNQYSDRKHEAPIFREQQYMKFMVGGRA